MSQIYRATPPDATTNILQDNIDQINNDESLRSFFSGTSFPTSPAPVIGQPCYRTDEKLLYIYTADGWVEASQIGSIPNEVKVARGIQNSLNSRLSVSLNDDGSLKSPATANVSEWKETGLAVTRVDGTSFEVDTDQTAIFTKYRKLKVNTESSHVIMHVTDTIYDSINDKTIVYVSEFLPATITSVDYGLVQNSVPAQYVVGPGTSTDGGFAVFDGIDGNRLKNAEFQPIKGPDSSIDGGIAVFDGTTGKVIKDSGISVVSGTSILYQGIRRVPSLTEPIGVALVQPGGGAGVWDRVDLNGNPIMVPPGYFSSRPEYQLNVTSIDSQSMVNIDKFHYLRKTLSSGPYTGKEAWFVNKTAFTGSAVHPAFLNTSGQEIDTFYVGAYEAFADGTSKAGSQNNKPPLVSIDFPTMVARCEARNTGGVTGFSLINIYQLAAIQYLALVEMGAPDAQSILGRGNVDSNPGSAMNTGTTDAIWRALHELWGNVWCMVQGIQQTNGQLQIWKNDGSQTFIDTGVTLPNSGYIATMSNAIGTGFNLNALFIPATVGSGSWGDYFYITKDGTTKVCYHGGSWNDGSNYGLFGLNLDYPSSHSYTNGGGRLAKV